MNVTTTIGAKPDPRLPTHCDHGVSLNDPCAACLGMYREATVWESVKRDPMEYMVGAALLAFAIGCAVISLIYL